MGNCLAGEGEDGEDVGRRRARNSNQPAIGKNQPLRHEIPKWKSELPLTTGQLTSKRDEFWDTAPAFEGRKEIWDALKAAAQACETHDFFLAQAIIDGANITIPHGYLTDCYDELGNRYQLPVYVLSSPTNIQRADDGGAGAAEKDDDGGAELTLKLRLSNGRDLKLVVTSRNTVGKVKQTLLRSEGLSPAQRWFYGGKILSDRTRIEEITIPKGHVIQVVLPYEPPAASAESGDDPTPVGS